MRITLDTNILVRGHQNAAGPGRSLLNLIVDSDHILVLSQSLLYALEEVMRYPRVRRLTGLSEAPIAEYVGYLAGAAELVDVGQAVPFSTPAADDWVVLRTAIRGDADIVFTGRTSLAAGIGWHLRAESHHIDDGCSVTEAATRRSMRMSGRIQ